MHRISSHLLPLIACMCCLLFESSALAQTAFYTFTSGSAGDGFVWDYDDPPSGLHDLPDDEVFLTPDGVEIYNDTGNVNYFDAQYQVAGNSSLIDNEAWWGNPGDSSAYADIYFENTFNGSVENVSFDLAWSLSGEDAPTELFIGVFDSNGYDTFIQFSLDNTFAGFGGFDGREGSVSINFADLIDESTTNPFDDITYIEVYFDEIFTGGPSSEFAIDNLRINEGVVGDPADSNIFPTLDSSNPISAVSTNRLKGSFDSSVNFDVKNDGAGDTTYSITIEPGSDAEFVAGTLPSGQTVAAGQTEMPGDIATVDSNLPSSQYNAQFRTHNDLKPADADELTNWTVEIFDPPALSDNSGSTVQADIDPQLSISNAAAGPHAGALRAGVEVTARSVTGTGFTVVGLAVDEFVTPGETDLGTVQFDRYGKLNGTYNGTFSVDLQMNSKAGSFLNGKEPAPSVNWNLAYDLATVATDSASFTNGETYGPSKIGVNNAQTAATLVGGEAASAQTVQMDLGADPEAGGDQTAVVLGSVLDLNFTTTGDLYVLQMSYDETNIPSGFNESELLPLYFDEGDTRWIVAMDANSNGGAGAQFITSSFEDFLAGLGEDPLPLSTFGLDTANNQIWAILDHASQFAVGVPLQEGDMNGDGVLNEADIDLFVLALVDRAAYDALNLHVNADLIGDINGSGGFNLGDVADFKSLFSFEGTTNSSAVPEPSGLLLAAVSVIGLGFFRRVVA